MFNLQAKSNST